MCSLTKRTRPVNSQPSYWATNSWSGKRIATKIDFSLKGICFFLKQSSFEKTAPAIEQLQKQKKSSYLIHYIYMCHFWHSNSIWLKYAPLICRLQTLFTSMCVFHRKSLLSSSAYYHSSVPFVPGPPQHGNQRMIVDRLWGFVTKDRAAVSLVIASQIWTGAI